MTLGQESLQNPTKRPVDPFGRTAGYKVDPEVTAYVGLGQGVPAFDLKKGINPGVARFPIKSEWGCAHELDDMTTTR